MIFALTCASMSLMAIDIYLWEMDQSKPGNPDATRILPGVITRMSLLGAVALFFGLFTLIFIRMIEPRDIKQRRLNLERLAELNEPAGSRPDNSAKSEYQT
jgi:hypothetical protein